MYSAAKESLQDKDALSVINEEIVPALDIVGKRFEEKKMYLPQLLMSAEAASKAFEAVKETMPEGKSESKGKIILATVKGDIHDIGKNIVISALRPTSLAFSFFAASSTVSGASSTLI